MIPSPSVKLHSDVQPIYLLIFPFATIENSYVIVQGAQTLESFSSNKKVYLNRKFFSLKICPADLSDILCGALRSCQVTSQC